MLRWTLTVVTVLLLGVWLGSMRARAAWVSAPASSQIYAGLARGAVYAGRHEWSGRPMPDGFQWAANGADEGLFGFNPVWWFDWTFNKGWSGKRVGTVAVPLWLFVLLAGAPTLSLWRTHRRNRSRGPNACPTCGYDLSGLPPRDGSERGQPTCPECGA